VGSVWAVILGVGVLVALGLLARARLARGDVDGGRPRASLADLPVGRSQLEPATPRGYSPKNVGNDASARPWESTLEDPAHLSSHNGVALPGGFDVDGFLHASKAHFISLQDAWDRADMPSLRAMMTADMLGQIQGHLTEREQQSGVQPGKTEVIMIDARLLGIEDQGQGYLASVEFSGLMREDGSAGPSPFREIWSINRAKTGPEGWAVAGVQALQ